MFYVVLSCHALLCLSLIGLVLLQQGKGADLGAALGGSSQSVFGAAGASGLLVKMTTSIAILFMVTSVLLVRMYQTRVNTPSVMIDPLEGSVMQKLGSGEQTESSATKAVDAEQAPQAAAVPPAEAPPVAEGSAQ